jgi:molecular chaperone DnaK (HSP70)
MAKLGIDLGTSNSAAAVVFDADEKNPFTIEPIEDSYGDLLFPSYVAFNRDGEFSVAGLPAKEKFLRGQPDLVVRHFKRLLGRPFDFVDEKISQGDRAFSEFKDRIKRSPDGSILLTVGDKDITVVEVASHLLRKIVEDSQFQIQKWGESIDSVVVTLPAGFDDSQRQATIAAARLAGLEGVDITAIEEPTAAAIARSLGGVEGKIMVIDVGAGTTDVIIGYMERTEYGPHLTMTNRDCDDVLGGMDMDYEILDYLRKNDTGSPSLEDIFHELDANQHLRLMGSVEAAKIVTSETGSGAVSTRLSVDRMGSKRIRVPLDELTLSEIVKPIVDGRQVNNYKKGIRRVVERALLKAAGGNLATVPKVINEIDFLILVGGPCRMKCLHQMLRDVFHSNPKIIVQIENLDRTDRLIKEAVAQGAALSQAKGVQVTTTVPGTVSIFHRSGVTPIIGDGTPYDRAKGTSRSASIPATQGPNHLWILSEKGSQPTRDWTMHGHIVNAPEEGNLKVTLKWGEGGVENDTISVEGCGLPGNIGFPPIHNKTILGNELEDYCRWYISVAKDLRRWIEMTRERLVRWLVPQVGTLSEAERRADELLDVSELDLRICDDIDVDTAGHLTDDEIDTAVKSGYPEMRQQATVGRGLLSSRVVEVLDSLVLPLLIDCTPVTPGELISEAKKLLSASRNCLTCMQYWQQLNEWSHRLELVPSDYAVASATATALGALLDCLHDQQAISEEEFHEMRSICWRFRGGR